MNFINNKIRADINQPPNRIQPENISKVKRQNDKLYLRITMLLKVWPGQVKSPQTTTTMLHPEGVQNCTHFRLLNQPIRNLKPQPTFSFQEIIQIKNAKIFQYVF